MIIIMIPAYNEEKNLPRLIEEIEQSLREMEVEHRLVVVDDGSTDATGEYLDEMSKKIALEAIHHEKNMNLGGAMKTGLNRVLEIAQEGDFIVTMDADNSHPPREILNLYDRLLDGPDVVVASRYKKGGEEVGVPKYRVLLSRGANWLFKTLFPIDGIRDYTGSFRGMRATALQRAWGEAGADVLKETGFTVMPEILLTLRKKGLHFEEIPLVLRYDLKGDASKMKVMKNVTGTLGLMARMFFGGRVGRSR
jgi:dolichol-phosphate mannosyltransferase